MLFAVEVFSTDRTEDVVPDEAVGSCVVVVVGVVVGIVVVSMTASRKIRQKMSSYDILIPLIYHLNPVMRYLISEWLALGIVQFLP